MELEFSHTEAKTIIAMFDFILANSAKNDIESSQLMKELIDLGIPKENCQSFAKVHDKYVQKVRAVLADKVLRGKTKIPKKISFKIFQKKPIILSLIVCLCLKT